MSQGCAKQSEENDGLEQQLKDAQYTRTGDDDDGGNDGDYGNDGDDKMRILFRVREQVRVFGSRLKIQIQIQLQIQILIRVREQIRGFGSKTSNPRV